MKMNVVDQIKEIIDTIRPFLINDGGDIEFVKYENNIVYIKLSGLCATCGFQDFTLANTIEYAIKDEISEVEKVVNIT